MNDSLNLMKIFARWIEKEIGCKAVISPTNNPAPKGEHIAIAMTNIRQEGDPFIPPPKRSAEDKHYIAYMYVAQVQFYEVEGNGNSIRKLRNSFHSDRFDDFVAEQTKDDSLDFGFSIWNIGDIVDNGTQDGTYYIPQKTLTIDFQFYDYEESSVENMQSVTMDLNKHSLTIEV